MNKKRTGLIGGSTATVIVAISMVLSMLGATVNVSGTYTEEKANSYATSVHLEVIEEVPNASFYQLSVETPEETQPLGMQAYGVDTGVVCANITVNPIDRVKVIVYDRDMTEIGVGELTSGGTVKYKIKDSEVTKNEE